MQSTVRPSPFSMLEQVEQLELMGDVEGRGRLVEQQQLGLLHERLGKHHELLLAARELGEAAIRQLRDAETGQRLSGIAARPRSTLARQYEPISTTSRTERSKSERELLRHQRHLLGHVAAAVAVRRPALNEHVAGRRPQHAVDEIDQRALAAAVGADDADEVAALRARTTRA